MDIPAHKPVYEGVYNMKEKENQALLHSKGQFLVYQAEDGKLKLDVRLEDETVWLTQQMMAELFQTTKQNISLHI